METGYAEVNGAKIYYETDGTGHPLVMVHAGIAHIGMWDEQFREFAKDYQVIRFDMRGYGKTEPVEGEFWRYEDLYGLLKFLGIKQAYLMGCSMGGGTCLDFTLEHPEMVDALMMVCSGPDGFEFDEPLPPQWDELVKAFKEGDLARTAELETQIWVDGRGRRDEHPIDPDMRKKVEQMDLIALKYEKLGLGQAKPLEPPAAKRLDEIHVPFLVVAGEYDSPYLAAAADYLMEHIEGAQKVVMPTAHLPSMERPDEFNAHVRRFLEGL